jgi:ABC transporter substrate binding protein
MKPFRSSLRLMIPRRISGTFKGFYRQAARLIVKIFGGAKPTDLPVEQPSRIALVINPSAAKTLGLTIPQAILARADEVIERPRHDVHLEPGLGQQGKARLRA